MTSKNFILSLFLFCMISSYSNGQFSNKNALRARYLKEILTINVKEDHRARDISRRVSIQDSTWLDWLYRTGELPPNFEDLKSVPFLPNPLSFDNGQQVRSKKDWQRRRKEIKRNYQYWISGHFPEAPKAFKSKILSERKEDQVLIQMIEVCFGASEDAKITFELMIPESDKPLPVYMTQWNHRNWASLAVRRGYIGCVYAAADDKDDTQAYQNLYPDCDFTCLMRRAWGASRVVDYLYTRDEVDKSKIAITGHSRNGKQSLWAAAFDERITAVVTSSCGTGGITPWRYSDPQYCNQTLDDIAANATHWFHPRLRFFFGREDRLPVDQNELLALIAPRALLMHYSIVEGQLNPWVNEQCYQSVKTVYDFLGSSDRISLFQRMGEHAVTTRDLEKCIDFLDIHFGRSNRTWENKRLFKETFKSWSDEHQDDLKSLPKPVKVDLTSKQHFEDSMKKMASNLEWLLGVKPAKVHSIDITPAPSYRVDWIESIIGRPQVPQAEVINLGPYNDMSTSLSGRLYIPKTGNQKYPVVIYLHQYSYAHGYALGYNKNLTGRGNSLLFRKLVDNGFAVMAIDMVGFGTRLLEGTEFYNRYSNWSKMGLMVEDVKSCLDAIPFFEKLDSSNVFILGNTIGGTVGLITAAIDKRVKGVASVASIQPWRSSNEQYPSIEIFSDKHMFLPRLGWFVSKPEFVPIDYEEILSMIAPQPLYLVVPTLDRHSDIDAVRKQMQTVYSVYKHMNKPQNLKVSYPREINRISEEVLESIVKFYKHHIE